MSQKDIPLRITKKLSLKAAYDEVYNSVAGKIVLENMMKEAGITSFREIMKQEDLWIHHGERKIVFSILKILGMDPKQILAQSEQNTTKTYEKQI